MIVSDTSGGHTRARCRMGAGHPAPAVSPATRRCGTPDSGPYAPTGSAPPRQEVRAAVVAGGAHLPAECRAQDVRLVEAGATRACVHGCRPIPSLVQAEGYFRAVAPKLLPGRGDGLLNRSPGRAHPWGPWKADGSAQPCKQDSLSGVRFWVSSL